MRAWATRATPYRELDNTAPGHAMCAVCERTGDKLLRDAAVELARFLTQRSKLAGVYASFERAPLIDPYDGSPLSDADRELLDDPGPGAFVDCLHFDPPFLVHLGVLTGDESFVHEGAVQALDTVRLLQSADTGIFHHFFLERTQRRYGYGWSRGQGWALLGLLDVLELLPASHPARGPLTSSLHALVEGLLATQNPSGHWPTLLDQPDAPLETSACLFFAAGIARAVRLGLVDRDLLAVADRAYTAGMSAVGDDGVVSGVSRAVWASTARGHYLAVPTGDLVPWGQGPLLLATLELERTRAPSAVDAQLETRVA
jgi:unsaturated rhamnogalacturonyl hydrolase